MVVSGSELIVSLSSTVRFPGEPDLLIQRNTAVALPEVTAVKVWAPHFLPQIGACEPRVGVSVGPGQFARPDDRLYASLTSPSSSPISMTNTSLFSLLLKKSANVVWFQVGSPLACASGKPTLTPINSRDSAKNTETAPRYFIARLDLIMLFSHAAMPFSASIFQYGIWARGHYCHATIFAY
ncbi:hypothetical protein ES703_18490 [subsurface metagenome]